MKVPFYVFDCTQGATFDERLQLRIGEAPLDLTGHTASMQVRPNVASSVILVELTTENGFISINPDLGEIRLSLSAEQTAAINVPHSRSGFPLVLNGVYDLFITSPEHDVTPLLRGEFNITARVTR
ncbi:MAG: hypothetical protein E6R08_11010 [Nevskiaceae bacterium]|nr:MAG: hypothetical protein E6R08_11010 [Nevskiaceae bacterium]